MKCVLLLLAFFAATFCSSEEEVTCMTMSKCLQDMAKFSQMDQGDLKEACGSMRTVSSCFKQGMEDCKNDPNMQNHMSSMENSMKMMDDMIAQHCGAGALKVSLAVLLLALFSFFLK